MNSDKEGAAEYTNQKKIMDWWDSKKLEEQLYLAIEANHLLEGDTVDNHPHKLSRENVWTIWDYNFNVDSIVRSNILKDEGYVPYCIPCPGLTRFKANGIGQQMKCPSCGTETKFSQTFLDEWTEVHNNNLKS